MEYITKLMKEHFYKIFGVIISGSIILYLLLCGGKYLWADEAYTFGMIRRSYGEIWKITAADVHPPLYYFILKLLTTPFSYSLLSAKVVSTLPYIFIIIFGGIQLRRLFDEKTAVLFMCLFFAFPFSMNYAIEVRMYSLAAAFVFANAIYAYRSFIFENNKSDWIFFVISGVGAAYTHYFALVSVGITYGLLLIAIILQKRALIRKWVIASFFTVLLYAPWLSDFINQLAVKINYDYWIEDITTHTVLIYIVAIFGAGGIERFALFFATSYFVALVYSIYTKKVDKISLCALLVPICTIGVGITVSLLIRPVFVARYVVPAIPLLVLFMAISVERMQNEMLVASLLTVALIAGISNYEDLLIHEYAHREGELDGSFVTEYSYCDSYIVLADEYHVWNMLAYYEPQKVIYSYWAGGNDIPHKNILPIDQFDERNNDAVVMFLNVGELPSTEFTENYNYEYIGEMLGRNIDVDAFILTKKIY